MCSTPCSVRGTGFHRPHANPVQSIARKLSTPTAYGLAAGKPVPAARRADKKTSDPALMGLSDVRRQLVGDKQDGLASKTPEATEGRACGSPLRRSGRRYGRDAGNRFSSSLRQPRPINSTRTLDPNGVGDSRGESPSRPPGGRNPNRLVPFVHMAQIDIIMAL